jgi:signal transduction histidine kinase
MLKISSKLTLWYTAATAIIILVIAIVVYVIYNSERRHVIDEELIDYGDFLINGFEGESPDLEGIFRELRDLKENQTTKSRIHRFAVISSDSLIFETNDIEIDSVLDEIQDYYDLSSVNNFITIQLDTYEYRCYLTPFKTWRGDIYTLVVITSLDKLYESLAQLRYLFILIVPISIIVAGFIGFLIARRAFKPVRAITETAAIISSSNLDRRVPIGKTQDELFKLAETINDMINRLDITIKSQQRFIADSSHDMRTPLTIIKTELELLLPDPDLSPKVKESLNRAIQEINRLNNLTDSLLILARADSHQLKLNKKNFRIDELIIDCLKQLDNIAKNKNIHFLVNINNPLEISADEGLLRRVLTNVIDNALKNSPENNTIKMNVQDDDRFCEIMVNNQGKIIPAELLPNIFDRFKRADLSRTTAGFGLGLSIAKTIIELHNGFIKIESNIKDGTSVHILIPIK